MNAKCGDTWSRATVGTRRRPCRYTSAMPDAIAASATAAPASGVPRRVAVTFGVVVALFAARWIDLPLLDPEAIRFVAGPGGAGRAGGLLSPVSLQLNPFVSAYLLVEVLALVHPGLRVLRHGGARDRLRLTRFAWGAGVLLAVIQGWGLATYLQSVRGMSGTPMLEPGLLPRAVVALTLAAGAVVTAWGAVLISWHGLGNGFAVLLAAETAVSLARGVASGAWGGGAVLGETGRLALVVLGVVVPLVAARLARDGGPGGMPLLTCGITPVLAPAWALALVVALSAWVPSLEPAASAWRDGGWGPIAVEVALAAAVAMTFARLFCPPVAVAAAFARGAPGEVRVDAAAARSANRRAVGFVIGLVMVPFVLSELGSVVFHPSFLVAVATVVAVAADLRAEARARAAVPGAVCARAVYRVYAVAPALAALAAAGIPAFARSRRYRGLFHFFAPWAPVEILVAPGRAADAEALCEHVEVGEGAEPLVPTSP